MKTDYFKDASCLSTPNFEESISFLLNFVAPTELTFNGISLLVERFVRLFSNSAYKNLLSQLWLYSRVRLFIMPSRLSITLRPLPKCLWVEVGPRFQQLTSGDSSCGTCFGETPKPSNRQIYIASYDGGVFLVYTVSAQQIAEQFWF